MTKFILAQILGGISCVFIFFSLQKNTKGNLLSYQIMASFCLAIQYLLLGAYTGFYMNLMCALRNIIFHKQKDKVSIWYLLLIILGMFILGTSSYDGIISILPTIGVIIYTIGLWQKKMTITRMTELFSNILVFIYNLKYYAITSLIATSVEIITVLRAIYRFDLKK